MNPKNRVGRAVMSFGLLPAFVLFAASTTVSGCGDGSSANGNAGEAGRATGGTANSSGAASGGNDNHAGQGTSTAGRTNNGGASSGGSAGRSNGGTSNGGANNGGASNGGKAGASWNCATGECFRANICLDHCGGTIQYTGCCECGAGTVEQLTCTTSGGQGAGGSAGAGGAGGSAGSNGLCQGRDHCADNQVCVAYRAVGGAVVLPDSNDHCMITTHVEDGKCQNDFTYACAELADCTAPSTACHCGPLTSCGLTDACRLPDGSSWLDKSAVIICEKHVP